MTGDYNILIGEYLEKDKDLFFGPLTKDDSFLKYPYETNFSKILKDIGVFKSTSEAKRQGFSNIPIGFSTYTIGKYRNKITILKQKGLREYLTRLYKEEGELDMLDESLAQLKV